MPEICGKKRNSEKKFKLQQTSATKEEHRHAKTHNKVNKNQVITKKRRSLHSEATQQHPKNEADKHHDNITRMNYSTICFAIR